MSQNKVNDTTFKEYKQLKKYIVLLYKEMKNVTKEIEHITEILRNMNNEEESSGETIQTQSTYQHDETSASEYVPTERDSISSKDSSCVARPLIKEEKSNPMEHDSSSSEISSCAARPLVSKKRNK